MTPEIETSLIGLRSKHGAESAIGHRCSNIAEALPHYQAATGERKARLAASVSKWIGKIEELTSR